MSMWLSGAWGLNANVVALDFFEGSNLIDLAVSFNALKRPTNDEYFSADLPDGV